MKVDLFLPHLQDLKVEKPEPQIHTAPLLPLLLFIGYVVFPRGSLEFFPEQKPTMINWMPPFNVILAHVYTPPFVNLSKFPSQRHPIPETKPFEE